MTTDPREILAQSPMSLLQITAVAMCILLNALDGFDVLAISFAAPGITADFGIDRAALGIVLAMELIGMAVGSILLGNLADRIGRRPTILACLVIMSSGMYLASIAGSVVMLSLIRLFTGLGIGGMLASVNAMVAEFSNARRRNMAVVLMATGYPLGAIVGGSIASILLVSFDWRSVFLFGAVVTAIFIPLTWMALPESIDYLMHKRPAAALERINATLRRMGHGALQALPALPAVKPRVGIGSLFSPQLMRTTLLLTLAYFAHIMTFYFILKWIPKIVVDMGYAASKAGAVLVWANVGGASGAILLGLLTQRFDVRVLVLGALLLSAVMVTVFGFAQGDLWRLSLVAAMAGVFTNSAIVGFYAILAQSFPTEVRAGGTGFVIGLGRGGAALGPIIPGFLFASGQGLPVVGMVMAAGSLIAAFSLLMTHQRTRAPQEAVI